VALPRELHAAATAWLLLTDGHAVVAAVGP